VVQGSQYEAGFRCISKVESFYGRCYYSSGTTTVFIKANSVLQIGAGRGGSGECGD
jgi:hypothetical protein